MDYKQVNDYEVMYMVKENDDDDARGLLLKKYLPIVSKIAARYLAYAKTLGIEFDDLIQEGMIALNKAISGYNDNNGVLFFTYACVCIDRHLITYCKRSNNKKNYYLNYSITDEDFYLLKDTKSSLDDFMNEQLAEESFMYYKNLFDIKYSSVFELRYNGFSYREISNLLDISIGTVDVRMSRVRKFLQGKYNF